MSKEKRQGVYRVYIHWHGMLKEKDSKLLSRAMAFFMGAWCNMTDAQAAMFLGLCNKRERKIIMKYPIWQ